MGTLLKSKAFLKGLAGVLVFTWTTLKQHLDISVKSSTIILTACMLSESYNFKSLLGNITAVWFLDQLDEMTANYILA